MTQNTTWALVIAHAATAIALSTAAVVSVWLAWHKFVGHRRVLIACCLFASQLSFGQVYAMVRLYRHDQIGWISVFFACATAATGAWLAAVITIESIHILETLTRTEARELHREESEKDRISVQQIYQYMAEENRLKSNTMIAQYAERGAKEA